MSKKLIAVAAAAALALTGLVGIAPAVAAPTIAFGDGLDNASTAGTSSAAPATVNAPVENELVVAADNVVELDLGSLATGDVIRVETTGSVKLVESVVGLADASVNFDVAKLGKTLYTKTTSNDDAITLYVFATSTTAGTVVVSISRTGLSTTTTLYLKALVGEYYNITEVTGVPATLAKNASADITFKLTDAFGNAVEGENITSWLNATTNLGTLAIPSAGTTNGWDSTAKVYKAKLTSLSNAPFLVTITATDNSTDGFADANYIFSGVVNNPAAATANTAATAQIAALTAQLAESRPKATSVTKKRFNTLARKWNAAFPSQKVALKK
jgi:hypothetical protein